VRRVDTRIIAATNANLVDRVKEGKFREDLYFRLSMFQIQIPPLREREADIPGLMRFLLRNLRSDMSGAGAMEIDPLAEEVLLAHTWPGNVRELENVMNRACILAEDNRISLVDLPAAIIQTAAVKTAAGAAISTKGNLRDQMRGLELEILRRAIESAGGDRRLAAQELGIGLSSLYRKMEELQQPGE
jgi:two-component system response regulator AtoC